MKRFIGIILLVFANYFTTFSQQKMNIIGVYHESGSPGDGGGGVNYYIQEDNTFIIIAYATLIHGKWEANKDNTITLYPSHKPMFRIYSRYNPLIKTGAKIMFQNFESGKTFIQVNQEVSFTPVFNEGANCVSYPSVSDFSYNIQSISLAAYYNGDANSPKEIYKFLVAANHNDFMAVYNSPRNNHRPITLKMTPKGLATGKEKVMRKSPLEAMEQEEKEWILQINESIRAKRNYLYVNPWYNVFDKYDAEIEATYLFDKQKNAYCQKSVYQKNEELKKIEDAYNKESFLYKYTEIAMAETTQKALSVASKSLFFVTCK